MDPLPPPINEQIAEVSREITMRERIYPRWIETGRLSPKVAEHQTEAMKAALVTLKAVASARTPQGTP